MSSLTEAQESSRCPSRQARLPLESDDSDRSHRILDEGKANHFVEESCVVESQQVETIPHMRLFFWAKQMPSFKVSTLLTKPHR